MSLNISKISNKFKNDDGDSDVLLDDFDEMLPDIDELRHGDFSNFDIGASPLRGGNQVMGKSALMKKIADLQDQEEAGGDLGDNDQNQMRSTNVFVKDEIKNMMQGQHDFKDQQKIEQ